MNEKSPEEMTKAELAADFYEHRHELAGDEVPSRQPTRLDVMVSTRFTRPDRPARTDEA